MLRAVSTPTAPAVPPTSSAIAAAFVTALLAAAGAATSPAALAAGSDGRQEMVQTSGKTTSKPRAVDADELVTLLPGKLGDWQQTMLGKKPAQRYPGPAPAVRAEYTAGAQTARIAVTTGQIASAAKPGEPRFTTHERAAGRDASVTVSLANGVQITATSTTADAAALEALLRAIDLARAESLKPAR